MAFHIKNLLNKRPCWSYVIFCNSYSHFHPTPPHWVPIRKALVADYNSRLIIITIMVLFKIRYHVPREWLQPTDNFLVLFEEAGGDVSKVSLVTQAPDKVCAQMSEVHPITKSNLQGLEGNTLKEPPTLHLDCTPGHNISQVVFGSFGNPSGTCGSFKKGSCHAPLSATLLNLVGHFCPWIAWLMPSLHKGGLADNKLS